MENSLLGRGKGWFTYVFFLIIVFQILDFSDLKVNWPRMVWQDSMWIVRLSSLVSMVGCPISLMTSSSKKLKLLGEGP